MFGTQPLPPLLSTLFACAYLHIFIIGMKITDTTEAERKVRKAAGRRNRKMIFFVVKVEDEMEAGG